MSTKQVLVFSVVIGLVCAGVVWWLEDFERRRLAEEWHKFVEGWGAKAGEAAAE